ncbi:MAG: SpoIIE family protein phosphatase [Blastochloris sp.]|nr:SpoIIE family protein phosphatase [Blastochloris sp.]
MQRPTPRRRRLIAPHILQQPGSRSSIAARLRWSYLVSSTLPLLIVGATLLFISASAQRQTVYDNQLNLARQVSRAIEGYVSDLYTQLDVYALRVRPGITRLNEWQSAALDLQASRYPNIIDLALIDTAGQELLRVAELRLTTNDQLRDLRDDAGVQQALRQRQTSFSNIAPNQAGIRSFFVTLPLTNDGGALIGVLRAELNADVIMRELDEATNASANSAYLIDSHNGAVTLGEQATAAPPGLERLLPSDTQTAEYVGVGNRMVVGAVEPVVLIKNDINTGWSVVVEQPSSIAFASVVRSMGVLVLLILIVGAGALLWAFRQSRQIIQPLYGLGKVATALGDGHLNYRISPTGDDEVADLARTFNQMAERLEHSLAEIELQNERLRNGLLLARDIQVGLLPDKTPWHGDLIDVYARSLPAYEVGGDFYTYLAMSEGRAAFAIGDISGKGVGAALLMALTSSAVEAQGREIEHPAEVLTALNRLLAPRLKANHMNAALLFAVIDPEKGELRVANAGMIAPVLITAGGNRFIDVGGLPVGAFPGAQYIEEQVTLNPGDALLLLSDGVVEAHNAHGELFGFERLEATITEANPPGDIRVLVELIIERVQSFMGEAEQHDDITLLAIRPALPVKPSCPIDEEQAIGYASV